MDPTIITECIVNLGETDVDSGLLFKNLSEGFVLFDVFVESLGYGQIGKVFVFGSCHGSDFLVEFFWGPLLRGLFLRGVVPGVLVVRGSFLRAVSGYMSGFSANEARSFPHELKAFIGMEGVNVHCIWVSSWSKVVLARVHRIGVALQ